MTDYRFKLGMYLPELRLPFDKALAKAKDIGAEYVWFNSLPDEPPIAEMSDAEVDRMGERVTRHGLEIFLIGASNPFKQIHLTDLDLATMERIRHFARSLITSSVLYRLLSVWE